MEKQYTSSTQHEFHLLPCCVHFCLFWVFFLIIYMWRRANIVLPVDWRTLYSSCRSENIISYHTCSAFHYTYGSCFVVVWYRSLQWWHRGGVSNYQRFYCLLNRLFRRTSKKTRKPASLAFVRGIHRWPVDSPHRRPVTWKMFSVSLKVLWGHIHLSKSLYPCFSVYSSITRNHFTDQWRPIISKCSNSQWKLTKNFVDAAKTVTVSDKSAVPMKSYQLLHCIIVYRKTSNISHIHFQNLNVSRLVL